MVHTLFVAAHPDDETLSMGVAIAEHVAAGQDVHVLWLTSGTASGVINQLNGTSVGSWWGLPHDPAAEGYQPLTPLSLGLARIAEATAAVRCLATGLPGTLTTHEAGLPDGAVTEADAAAAILSVADAIAPNDPVRIKTHSHLVDNHPDHLAIGAAAKQLKVDDPDRFGDLRHYVLPPYWTDARLSQVSEAWDHPTDAGITRRVRNGIRAYGAWQPEAGAYAIGWHSVPTYFTALDTAPKCMFHP